METQGRLQKLTQGEHVTQPTPRGHPDDGTSLQEPGPLTLGSPLRPYVCADRCTHRCVSQGRGLPADGRIGIGAVISPREQNDPWHPSSV